MFDHVTLNVKDLPASRRFYEASLEPLGWKVTSSDDTAAGIGRKGEALWLTVRPPTSTGVHVAFAAETREAVDSFYKAGMKTGGKDNGKPGIRADYDPSYYAAFVIDPDGNNVEAVCRK